MIDPTSGNPPGTHESATRQSAGQSACKQSRWRRAGFPPVAKRGERDEMHPVEGIGEIASPLEMRHPVVKLEEIWPMLPPTSCAKSRRQQLMQKWPHKAAIFVSNPKVILRIEVAGQAGLGSGLSSSDRSGRYGNCLGGAIDQSRWVCC